MNSRLTELANANKKLDLELVAAEREIKRLRRRLQVKVNETTQRESELQDKRDSIMFLSEATVIMADEIEELITSGRPVNVKLYEKHQLIYELREKISNVHQLSANHDDKTNRLLSALMRSLSSEKLKWFSEVAHSEHLVGSLSVDCLGMTLASRENECYDVTSLAASSMGASDRLDADIANLENTLDSLVGDTNLWWSQKTLELADAFTQNVKVLKDERLRLTKLSSENRHVLSRMGIKPSCINVVSSGSPTAEYDIAADGSIVMLSKPSTSVADTSHIHTCSGHSFEEKMLFHKERLSRAQPRGTKVTANNHTEVVAQDALRVLLGEIGELRRGIIDNIEEYNARSKEADIYYCRFTEQRDANENARSHLRRELSDHQSFRTALIGELHEWKVTRRQLSELIRLLQ